MLGNIYNIEQLEKEANEIQSFLDVSVSDEPAEVELRGHQLSVYLARSGKMLADAKYHKDRAVKRAILHHVNEDIAPSILKDLASSECDKENYLVNWVDRINRSCTHQMDWLRSVLSKHKEEMRMSMIS